MRAVPSPEEEEELFCVCKRLKNWGTAPKDFHFCLPVLIQCNRRAAVLCQAKINASMVPLVPHPTQSPRLPWCQTFPEGDCTCVPLFNSPQWTWPLSWIAHIQQKFPNVLALSPRKLVPVAMLLLLEWEVVFCVKPRFIKTLQYLILKLKEKICVVLKFNLLALSRVILVKHCKTACRTCYTCSVNKTRLSVSQTVVLTNFTGTKVNKCLS